MLRAYSLVGPKFQYIKLTSLFHVDPILSPIIYSEIMQGYILSGMGTSD